MKTKGTDKYSIIYLDTSDMLIVYSENTSEAISCVTGYGMNGLTLNFRSLYEALKLQKQKGMSEYNIHFKLIQKGESVMVISPTATTNTKAVIFETENPNHKPVLTWKAIKTKFDEHCFEK